MQIDLRTVSIKPLRNTYDHVAERLGGDKAASRYQEGTLDLQANANFHYRPYWDPTHEIHDVTRTSIVMKDWYAFKDPRQMYYGVYTITRARQQEAAEANYAMIEERNLAASMSEEVKRTALAVLVPLRHVEWAGNMNGASICAYGYGTGFTQPAIYHSMDHLGMAQYLTRIGLVLGSPAALDAAKTAWLDAPEWQGLRRYVEDTLVVQDVFELFVAQAFALEGMMFPLVFDKIDAELVGKGGMAVSMMTRFMAEWFTETQKWVDATMKTAAAESPENAAKLAGWVRQWGDRAASALAPIATLGLGEKGTSVMVDLQKNLAARAAKQGIAL